MRHREHEQHGVSNSVRSVIKATLEHREQMGEQATYFDRNSAQSLADGLTGSRQLIQQRELQANVARDTALQCVGQFAGDLVSLAEYCLNRHT